jgi:hypothetical protein
MSRPLLALAVIAASSVVGVWMQAATRDGDRSSRAPSVTAPLRAAEPSAAVAAASDAVPPAESKSASKPVVARSESRTAVRSRAAEPAPAALPAKSGIASAMRVAADPITGQLIAPEHAGPALSIEQMQDLARLEALGLITVRNADGSETFNHDGRFTDFSVVRVGADGKPVFRCVHGEFGVDHTLRHSAPVTPNGEDR